MGCPGVKLDVRRGRGTELYYHSHSGSEFTRDWKSPAWWCIAVTLVFMKLWAEAGECQVGGQLGYMVSLSQNQTKSKGTRSSSRSGTTRGWRYHRSPGRRRRMAEGG